MKQFFNPKTIAVIGASRSRRKVGNIVFRNLLKDKRKVYAVNIKAELVEGKRSYKSVLNIKKRISLAVICIPAKFVPKVVEECGIKKIRNVIIISSGFSEIGRQGKRLENQIKKIAKKYKIRILGPNCLGVINVNENLNATFFEGDLLPGDVAFISQSGALGVAVLDWAIKEGLGFSKFISIGNAVDIEFNKLTEYLNEDKNTKVIALYIESLKDGKKFMEICKKVKKPIIVLKAGKTKAGIKATASHTGALVGSYDVYLSAFKQSGVLNANSIKELLLSALFISNQGLIKGKKACILTNAGGPGVLCADNFEFNGFEIADIPKKLMKELNKVLPKQWSHNNPIDVIGDAQADRYKKVLNLISKKPFFDFLICLLTPQAMTEPIKTAQELVKFHKKTKIPVITCFMGGKRIERAVNILKENQIMNFENPKQASDVIKILF